ncbi:MAG: transposase [Planctomycetota bacterium]
MKNRKRAVQGEFAYRSWGGSREGAGRKPKGDRAGVDHRPRGPLAARFPVHVTVRLVKGLPSLRRRGEYAVILSAFGAGCKRFGFRLVEYSVLGNHIHILAEAKGRAALARGMQGLLVRLAKGLNKLWGRKGSVFSDRYHDHVLKTPREVRNALVYVLQNAKKHGIRLKLALDYFSSAPWFNGWREKLELRNHAPEATAMARTWLLMKGWRRRGLLSVLELPRTAAA